MSAGCAPSLPNQHRRRGAAVQRSMFNDLSTIGGRLRFAREYRGIGIVDLAEKAGIGLATIRDLEAGNVTTTPHWIALLADALECEVTWLATGKAAA